MKRRERISYEEKYELMKEYMEVTGEQIHNKTVYKGYKLGLYRNNMRTLYFNGKLKISEELENKFIELGVLKKKKERIRKTNIEKYNELIELINMENPSVEVTDRIHNISLYFGASSRKGKLNLSKEQIGVLVRNKLLAISQKEINEYYEQSELSHLEIKSIIEFFKANVLEEININDFIKYIEILRKSGNLKKEPVIISDTKLSEIAKRTILDRYQEEGQYPDIYFDYKAILNNMNQLNEKTKKALSLRLGNTQNTQSKKYREIAGELNISHQDAWQLISRSLDRFKQYAKKDIKYDIYTKLLIDKKEDILEFLNNNSDKNMSLEEQVKMTIKFLNSRIQLKDLSIPNYTIDILNEKNIITVADIQNILNGINNTNLKDEDVELINSLITECNLEERINYIENNLNNDLSRIINSGKIGKNYIAKIESLNLSVRAFNCLKRAGISDVGELIVLGEESIRNIKYLGERGYNEIIKALAKHGISIDDPDKSSIQNNLKNAYEFLVSIRTQDREELFRRIELYNNEISKQYEERAFFDNIPPKYLEEIKRYIEEQELHYGQDKQESINEILRKQKIIKEQENEIMRLEHEEQQEK